MAYPHCNNCDHLIYPERIRQELTQPELQHYIRELEEDTETDNLFERIVKLDERVSDWQFTVRLADHFAALKTKYGHEIAGDELAARLRPRSTAADHPYGRMPESPAQEK